MRTAAVRLWPRVSIPAFLVATAGLVFAASGDLDPSFGFGGVAVTEDGPNGGAPNDIAVQDDGRIVVAGIDGNVSPYEWLVRRYEADGTVDFSFGAGGSVSLFEAAGGWLADVALDASGRILAVGDAGPSPSKSALVRLNGDGTVDSSFGSGGVVMTSLGTAATVGRAVAVQSDGKILFAGNLMLAGTKKSGPHNAIFLARCHANGALDTSFGTGGVTTRDLTTANDIVHPGAIALQSNGKILLAGSAGSDRWAITRYLANGAADAGFGVVKFTGRTIGGLAVDAQDRIVASGNAPTGGSVVVRYTAAGTVDASFGTYGATTVAADHGNAGPVIDADGSIVFAGTISPSASLPNWRQAVAVRVLSNGGLDGSFGTGGIGDAIDVYPAYSSYFDSNLPTGLALDADGRVLVAGQAVGVSGSGPFATTRHIAWFVGAHMPE